MKTKNGNTTEQSIHDMFAQRQLNQAMMMPDSNGVVQPSQIQASAQATANAVAIQQVINQHELIQTQNGMLMAKDVIAAIDRARENGDVDGTFKFTIFE